MIELILPYPPCVNHYKRVGRIVTTRTGKLYQQKINTNATKQFYYEVWMRIKSLNQIEGIKSFDDAMISMKVYMYPPDRRKRDVDGILKVLLDSMEKAGLYNDDYQVARLLVDRKEVVKNGKLVVRMELYV